MEYQFSCSFDWVIHFHVFCFCLGDVFMSDDVINFVGKGSRYVSRIYRLWILFVRLIFTDLCIWARHRKIFFVSECSLTRSWTTHLRPYSLNSKNNFLISFTVICFCSIMCDEDILSPRNFESTRHWNQWDYTKDFKFVRAQRFYFIICFNLYMFWITTILQLVLNVFCLFEYDFS